MQKFSPAPSARGLWTSASYLSVTRISESCVSLASVTSRNILMLATGARMQKGFEHKMNVCYEIKYRNILAS